MKFSILFSKRFNKNLQFLCSRDFEQSAYDQSGA